MGGAQRLRGPRPRRGSGTGRTRPRAGRGPAVPLVPAAPREGSGREGPPRPGPYLEASALGAADGGPPPVHHHHVVGAGGPRLGPGAAPARRGPKAGAGPRGGSGEVPQHQLHPPHRPSARRRRHLVTAGGGGGEGHPPHLHGHAPTAQPRAELRARRRQ